MESALTIKKQNKAYWFLVISSFVLYVVMTCSKNLYVAEKTTFYTLGTFGNLTDLAATMEYYFYTYSIAQIVMAFFMKRLNLKWYVTVCVGASAVLTLLMAFTGNIIEHYVLYTVNGFFQACLWGCQIKVFSMYLPKRLLPTANQLLTSGPAVAGASAYGIAAAFGDRWREPFFVMGIVLFVSVLVYFFAVTNAAKYKSDGENRSAEENEAFDEEKNDFIHLNSRKRVIWFYIVSVIMGALVTSIYFALNNNLDIFLKEIGMLSNDGAKWLTIFAPLVATVGPILVVRFCERYNNFIAVCGTCFAIAMAFLILLLLFFEVNVILSLVLMIIFLTIVNGGRSISLSIAALRMRKKIDSGVYSTLVNVASSLASGIAPKAVAVILDNNSLSVYESWRMSLLTVLGICVFTVISLFALFLGIKRLNKKDEAQTAA